MGVKRERREEGVWLENCGAGSCERESKKEGREREREA